MMVQSTLQEYIIVLDTVVKTVISNYVEFKALLRGTIVLSSIYTRFVF